MRSSSPTRQHIMQYQLQSDSMYENREKMTLCVFTFTSKFSLSEYCDIFGHPKKITNSGLSVFYLCFQATEVFSPFSHLWVSPAFSPKILDDVSKPCISSIATIIFQITCFMLLFSCRRDSAPAALRSQSLWIHTTLICLFVFPQKDRLHRLKHQTSLPVLDVS